MNHTKCPECGMLSVMGGQPHLIGCSKPTPIPDTEETKMKRKSPVIWYKRVECGDSRDNYCNYKKQVYQPNDGWYPVNEKYSKDKWRFNKDKWRYDL